VAVINKCTPICAVIPSCNTKDFKPLFGSQIFAVVRGTNFERQALLLWSKVRVRARACVRQQRLSALCRSINSCSTVVETGQTSNPGPSEGEQRTNRNVAT
jgi:hypothetical protein